MQPTTARWVFIAFFCMLSALRLYFRIRSGLFREAVFSPSEPVASIAARCVLGIPLIAGTIAYCFFPGRWPWAYVTITCGLRIGGTILSAGALLLLASVHRALGGAFTTGPAPRGNRRLVTVGPYAFVRHPMYVSYFLLFSASFPLTGSWLIAAGGLGVIGLLMTWRRRLEEALLFDRFGEEYARYHARAGAFLPRIRHRL